MFRKDIGAQILLYGAYVSAVAIIIQFLFLTFIGLFVFGLFAVIIGGFMVWMMYSAAKEYMDTKDFKHWKAWVVLVLSALGILSALMSLNTANFLTLLVNAVMLFGAAALLFGADDTEVA